MTYYKNYLSQFIDFDNLTLTAEEKKVDKYLNQFKEVEAKNEKLLRYINTPSSYHVVSEAPDKAILPEILKKAMSF